MKPSLVAGLLSVGIAVADAVTVDIDPCLSINLQIKAQSGPQYQIDTTVALKCLRSAPLDTQNNTRLLQAFKSFAQFESRLAYLKDPPPGALYPAVDIVAGIDEIGSKLSSGHYKNEYDFQFDLWTLSQRTYDYHFNYNPDIVELFTWKRDQALFSLSKDGISLPEIYLEQDVPVVLGGISSYSPSPVVQINGVDVETWLNDYASQQPFGHDPDANYNNVLWRAPLTNASSSNLNGTFTSTSIPQKLNTIIKFANDTKTNIWAYAVTTSSFDGVVDGQSFFEKFCTGQVELPPTLPDEEQEVSAASTTAPSKKKTASATSTSDTPASATLNFFTAVPTQTSVERATLLFPDPLVITEDLSIAGYLPADLPDTAILQIPTFDPSDKHVPDFQNAVRGLLATAQSRGIQKLIVDLRGNGGGKVALGYDTFRQIFPNILPYGGTTVRSTPLLRDIQTILYNYTGTVPEAYWSEGVNGTLSSSFNLRDFLDKDNKNFTSAEAFLGPYKFHGDDLTAIQRINLNQTRQTLPVSVYGFGDNILPIQQAYKPENIVVLQDGLCGSTCAVFSEFMKSQANVKTIVVGGRKQYGPMQGVGGTKGAEVIGLDVLTPILTAVSYAVSPAYVLQLSANLLDLRVGAEALFKRTSQGKGARINYRNNIRQGDDTLTPLQYVYEAADCRFFYTPEMIVKQSLVWKMVRDIQWGNSTCVVGSADHESSLSGPHLSYISAYPPTGANYTFGAKKQPAPNGTVSLNRHTVSPTAAASTGASVFAKSTTAGPSRKTSTAVVTTVSSSIAADVTTTTVPAQSNSPQTTSSAAARPTGAGRSRFQDIGAGGLAAAAIAVHLLL